MTDKINQAVKHQLDRIALAQQNITAMYQINTRLTASHSGQNKFNDRLKDASNAYWSVLHEELSDAWNGLAWFAAISEEAMGYLAERTKTWFSGNDNEIMSFLGYEGSYYTKNKEEFRKQVLAMFGAKRVLRD